MILKKKVDELSVKLAKGDIQVTDIPDELFIPVAKRTILCGNYQFKSTHHPYFSSIPISIVQWYPSLPPHGT